MCPRLLLALGFVALLCATRVIAEPTTGEGLAPTKVRHFDEAYQRPGTRLSGYSKILFRPISVSFSRHWDPRNYGTFGLEAKEVEEIRGSLAKIAAETFRETLSEGGYSIVDAPSEGVLELNVEIVDLYVNAPAEPTVGTKVYAMSAGEMRLVITLKDAVSGTTLFKAVDKKRGPDAGRLEWVTKAWNRAEARRMLEGWAKQLQEILDQAKTA